MKMARWIACAGAIMGGVVPLVAGPAAAQQISGDFHGTLSVGATDLRLGLSLTQGADGTLTGTMVSPDQSPKPLDLSAVGARDGRLSFSVPAVGGRYEGLWDPARGAWLGTWTQGGQPLPLVLSVGKLAPVSRPQEPKPPFPYAAVEVAFDSVPGVRLAGTFTRPPGAGPFPAVVLVSGSGPQNRDQELLGHKPFLVLADYLTRRGIAGLRYDDRGTASRGGSSTGNFATATSWDFADDARAALAWLRGQPGVDAGRVGLVGHSEGALIGTIVAEKDPALAFLVMLAGPGVPGAALMSAQREATARAMGLSAEFVSESQKLGRAVDRAVIEAKTPAAAQAAVRQLLIQSGVPASAVAAQTAQVTTPWYAAFVA